MDLYKSFVPLTATQKTQLKVVRKLLSRQSVNHGAANGCWLRLCARSDPPSGRAGLGAKTGKELLLFQWVLHIYLKGHTRLLKCSSHCARFAS
ncbi:hypothetical protein AV530_010882 [Patagioenas fasciata monilis]|uniref:Uncharacterized protein n=1 Tax=Patagioenas fasciata monilis TaxID=372326 RepID=A0A1V4K826_PATFA|nr:hypothetical protein AV530_010882 [Patagioenas fasciata monilis]